MESKKQKSKVSKLLNIFRNLNIKSKENNKKEKAPSDFKTKSENNTLEKKYSCNPDSITTKNSSPPSQSYKKSSNICENSALLKYDEVKKEPSTQDDSCPNNGTKVKTIREFSVKPKNLLFTSEKEVHVSQSESKNDDLFDNRSIKLEPIDNKLGIVDNFMRQKFDKDNTDDEFKEYESDDENKFNDLIERGPDRNQGNLSTFRHVEYKFPERERENTSRVTLHPITHENFLQNVASPKEFSSELYYTDIEKAIADIEIEQRIADIKRKKCIADLEREKQIIDLEIENRIAEIQSREENENYFATASNSPLYDLNDLSSEKEKDEILINSILQLDYNILPGSISNVEENACSNQLTLADSSLGSCSSAASFTNRQQTHKEEKKSKSAKDELMQSESFCSLTYKQICKKYEEELLSTKDYKVIYFLNKEGRSKYRRTNLHKAVMNLNLEETCAIIETHKRYCCSLSFDINLRDNRGESVLDRAEKTNNLLLIAYLKENYAKNSIHHMLPINKPGT